MRCTKKYKSNGVLSKRVVQSQRRGMVWKVDQPLELSSTRVLEATLKNVRAFMLAQIFIFCLWRAAMEM